MNIDKALISKLEQLCRLELAPEERDRLLTDLNEILKMVEKLEELDTEVVRPLIYVSGEEGAELRADEIEPHLSRDRALANAPKQDGEFFRAPKVIDL